MMNTTEMENPFSTKFWSAGAIPFRFSEREENIEKLVEHTRQHRVCQIVGPHGSGKSTLLLSLLKQYEKSGEHGQRLFFNAQHRHLPNDITFQKSETIFADGFEQLRMPDRLRLLLRSNRLILTAHRPVWFVPILYRTKPQFAFFIQFVRERESEGHSESELRAMFERSNGNFRSAFFELYDQWEQGKKRDGQ